ncbi:MAG: DUF1553 domain-containing protein [Opitutus sp.]|nr:DUF1553 domain-containing protein [Opitutus sp.]
MICGQTVAGLFIALAVASAAAPLRFNRDVRPILSENCFHCHGRDEARREGKLRLDERAGAVQAREGIAAVVPGKPDESELIRRIEAKAAADIMPPPESHRTLTAAQIATLRRWITEGAGYEGHWAFQPPAREPAPKFGPAGPAGEIDHFVRALLARDGLRPAEPAEPGAWLRRASLDLTGLPPTVAELDRFEAAALARGENAYGDAVERLLASPHFGERMALEWLDAARYADTHGFNNDSARSMWRWRDWVIQAFNRNLPYDRFIVEQLAGDLLPSPTVEQRIATGFGRNHVINSEGGIIDEEYRVEYVADRVKTLSTVWLGVTMECARCHDHKYDPISQQDYYRLFAFFNHVQEQGEDGRVANAAPIMAAPTAAQQEELTAQDRQLAALDGKLAAAADRWKWDAATQAQVEVLAKSTRSTIDAQKGAVMILSEEKTPPEKPARAAADDDDPEEVATPEVIARMRTVPAARMDFSGKEGLTVAFWLRTEVGNPRDTALFSSADYSGSQAAGGYGRGRELRLVDGELELRLNVRFPAYALVVRTAGAGLRPGEWRHIAVTYAGGRKASDVRMFVDGEEAPVVVRHDGLSAEPPKRDYLVGADNAKASARLAGAFEDARSYPRVLDAPALRALFRARALPEAAAALAEGRASARQRGWLADAWVGEQPGSREQDAEREALLGAHLALRRSLPNTMVMEEMPAPRGTFVLNRGLYDSPGEAVEPGVPAVIGVPWPEGAPRNRLGLARWLTDPRHPLTGRVVVNRFWAQFFGTGLVKTLEDFGSQAEWPSHPELLDWLARDFVDGGWDVKALVRKIVLSATYRQSSATAPAALARDPENRLLARSPRVRLPAELIRDQALAVSGLLVPRLGGPSVYPYQPDKLYEGVVVGVAYPGTSWGQSSDSDLYRRSLYTFWKRTLPHPAMTIFDAPDREFCTVRRSRTNTPLQALVLWNEPGLVEAARRLGTRMLREAPGDDAARLAWAFRATTGRRPEPAETAALTRLWDRFRADYAANPATAERLLRVGASAADASVPPAELAAATAVASALLSLDETITKN